MAESRRPCVVVVDDEPDVLDLLSLVLARQGYEVHVAPSGPMALELVRDLEPDAVVADLYMPVLSGLDVLDACQSIDRELAVLLLTGHASLPTAIEAVARGARGYLVKPIEAAALCESVRGAVEKTRWHRERARLLEELAATNARLEAAHRAKNDFLARMSHEMRTPLTGILGTTDLALDTELSERQRNLLTLTRFSAGALLRIVDDLLDVEKLAAGKLELSAYPGVLAEQLELRVGPLRALAGRKSIGLELELDPALPAVVICDFDRLGQILLNLVSNAVKFTEAGGVRVRLERGAGGPGEELELRCAVEDTGIGIPADKREMIFEPFTQADGSISRTHGGTGLGLSIAAHLVELMGGSIAVESEVGRGSCFSFTVRCRAAAAEAVRGTPPARLDVLVVEDNPVNGTLVRSLVERRGHRVELVVSGDEAVERVVARRFDLVLMDMQLPGTSGLDATARIRALGEPHGAPVRIVALTACASPRDRARCLEAGMDDYVAKPVEPSELDRVLEAAAPRGAGDLYDAAALLRRADGDPELARAVADAFGQSASRLLELAQQAAHAGDAAALGAAAHAAKGAALTLGAHRAAEAARAVEDAAAQGDFARVQRALPRFVDELVALEAALPVRAPPGADGSESREVA